MHQSSQEPQTLVCFIDWLGLSLGMSDAPRSVDGFAWAEYSATNVWKKRRVLYTDAGDRVCTLLSEPISKMLAADSALLEIDNEWLYHGGGTDSVLETLSKSVFYTIRGVSRLDLAVDFVPTDSQSDVILGLSSKKYRVAGKQNGSEFTSVSYNCKLAEQWQGRKIPHQQSWGHKTSSVKWKLYYKTKELLDAGGGRFFMKPYIVDQWRMLGMDISNVWRLEVSMQHLNDYTLYGSRITLDDIRENRAALFVSMYNSRFKVQAEDGHKDKSNDRVIPFLPIQQGLRVVGRALPRKMAEHNGRITLLRHLVASLEDEHVLLDTVSRRAVFEHVSSIVRRDGLQNYFRMVTGMYLDDWMEEREKCACDLVATTGDDVLTPSNGNKGSAAAERQIGVGYKVVAKGISPNSGFETYSDDGAPVPTTEGEEKAARRPPRATVQYTFPLKIRMPQWMIDPPVVTVQYKTPIQIHMQQGVQGDLLLP